MNSPHLNYATLFLVLVFSKIYIFDLGFVQNIILMPHYYRYIYYYFIHMFTMVQW